MSTEKVCAATVENKRCNHRAVIKSNYCSECGTKYRKSREQYKSICPKPLKDPLMMGDETHLRSVPILRDCIETRLKHTDNFFRYRDDNPKHNKIIASMQAVVDKYQEAYELAKKEK